jgi:hypothetical protein
MVRLAGFGVHSSNVFGSRCSARQALGDSLSPLVDRIPRSASRVSYCTSPVEEFETCWGIAENAPGVRGGGGWSFCSAYDKLVKYHKHDNENLRAKRKFFATLACQCPESLLCVVDLCFRDAGGWEVTTASRGKNCSPLTLTIASPQFGCGGVLHSGAGLLRGKHDHAAVLGGAATRLPGHDDSPCGHHLPHFLLLYYQVAPSLIPPTYTLLPTTFLSPLPLFLLPFPTTICHRYLPLLCYRYLTLFLFFYHLKQSRALGKRRLRW